MQIIGDGKRLMWGQVGKSLNLVFETIHRMSLKNASHLLPANIVFGCYCPASLLHIDYKDAQE